MWFAVSPFRYRRPSEAARSLQEGPREPQEESNRVPKRPESSQERSKSAQVASLGALDGHCY
eukprot:8076138-Pyramimonas_sp.AAC.1